MHDARIAMRKGSLSFYLASRILPRAVRDSVTLLYHWCRHCDDQVDGQRLGMGEAVANVSIDHLDVATAEGIAGSSSATAIFRGMGDVVRQHEIPEFYVEELLAGMRMDAEGQRYESLEDLRRYCYRVAGTVGLMFAHISGVSSPAARRHSADLGIAMQMTNIARDVAEDLQRGRVYLPLAWLRKTGVPPDRLLEPPYRKDLCEVVRWLLEVADDHYRSGDAGLIYLPWRVAWAVASARQIYSDIGRRVLALDEAAWKSRVRVSLPRKLWLVGRAFLQVGVTLPARWKQPWQRAILSGDWRLS